MYILAVMAALAAVGAGSGAAVATPRTEIRSIMVQAAVWLAVIAVALCGLMFLERIA